jgi:hypothetical protein
MTENRQDQGGTVKRRLPRRDGRKEVLHFFDEIVPRAISQSPDKFIAQEGTVSITVPAWGSWTIRFGSFDEPYKRGAARDADLRVWLSPSAAAGLISGKLNVAQATRDRQIRLSGVKTLFERFGFLLEVGGSPLQTMLTMRGG